MFDAGFLEMLVIGIIALMVVGPERLPKLAATVGRWIGKGRALVAKTKQDLEREVYNEELQNMLIQQKEEIDNLKNMVQKGQSHVEHELNDIESDVQSLTDDVTESIKPSPDSPGSKQA